MKTLIKCVVRIVAQIVMMPFILWHKLVALFAGPDRALEWSSQYIALLPGLSGQYLRRAFLAWAIRECHPSATICFGTIFSKASASIGENVYIGPYCSLGSAIIERDVLIATGVQIPSGANMHGTNDITKPIREQPGEWKEVRIGAGCWVGSNAVVMADVGANSIVAAGAVVIELIPALVIAGGVPARVLKNRS